MNIIVKTVENQPETMERLRQQLAGIELPDPHPEDDCGGHDDDGKPECLEKVTGSGKFKSTGNKIKDFKDTFSYKFLTPENELHRYKHNDEKNDDDYKNQDSD